MTRKLHWIILLKILNCRSERLETGVEILTPTEDSEAAVTNGPFQILSRFSTRRKTKTKKENKSKQISNNGNTSSACCQIN